MEASVEDLLQDVDLTACLEQSSEFEAPLFGNIFDELCLPDDLWQDVEKIPLLNETKTKEPETVSQDEKLKTTNNMSQPTRNTVGNTVVIPALVNNGLQNIKTEVVHPMNCMVNNTAIPMPATVTIPTISATVANSDKQGVKRSHPDSNFDMSQLSKRQQKMLKNRQSSSLSRQRKKEYVSTLEAQLSEAAQKNSALIKENEALRAKVKILEKENQMLQISKPHGLLTPPRTPAMLAIVLFVTFGLMLSPLRTMISTGNVEVEHVSAPMKMHRALLTINDNVETDHYSSIKESHAVGPHLPDQLVTETAMEQMKSLHKTKKQAKKKVLKPIVDNVNSTNTARLHADLRGCFSSHEAYPWYTGSDKTSAVAVVDHETQSPRVYRQDMLSFPYNSEKIQYFFKKSFSRDLQTYYLVSFKDHLMLNAPLHNKTLLPKLSVMIPFNESSVSSKEDLSMIQMECSVIDTKLLTIKLPPDMS